MTRIKYLPCLSLSPVLEKVKFYKVPLFVDSGHQTTRNRNRHLLVDDIEDWEISVAAG
jgi:hypothetical protein